MFEQFFSNLRLDENNPIVDKVTFGDLMREIDWSRRWIYKGSMTFPPCSQYVYWNVI